MKVHHITEAPRIEPTFGGTSSGTTPSGPKVSSGGKPVTGITGTKAAFANKNGGVSKGTIVGPAKNGNPNQVSFKDSKGKTFNVSIKKLLDPKKLTPLNIGLGTSTTTATPKADTPKADLKADPKLNAPKADAPKGSIGDGVWKKIKFGGKVLKVIFGGTLGQIAVQYMNLANINSIIKEHYKIVGEHGYPSQQAKDSRRDMAWAITDIIVEGFGAFIGAVVSTYVGLAAVASIAGTGVGIILLGLIGAVGAIGGAIGTSELLKLVPGIEKGIHGFIVDVLSKHVINRPTMETWGKANMSDPEFALWYGMLYMKTGVKGTIGKGLEYVLDDEDYDDTPITEEESAAKTKKDAVKLIKSAPNGVENFNKGKELVRQAMAKQQTEKAKKADL